MANDMKLQFNIGATFSELKTAVAQAKTELKSLVDTVKKAGQEVKIKVGLDITGLNTDIQHLKTTVRNALQGSATEKIKVKIEADAASIKADIAALKPQIQSALSTFAPISLTINHAKLAQHLQAAKAQISAALASMASHASLNIHLNVDAMSTGLITALNALKAEVVALKQVMAKKGGGSGGSGGSGGGGLGGASADVNGFASAMRDAKTQLMQLVSAFGLLIGLKGFANITDEAKSLESKLKLVTSSQQELNQVTAALREIAKNNLQGLSPTVELYSKLSSGTKNLEGANTALNTRLTDIVSKLVTISGSTGPAAEGAIIQFGQALSGNFSAAGQELNSIIEQAPALADAIAKSYGVTRGELKKLGAEGKITAEGVVNGLIKQGIEVDSLFGKVNKTIGGTATTTGEALKLLIVDIDKAIGLSALMIGALVAIRDNLSEIILVAKLAGIYLAAAFAPAIASAVAAITLTISSGLMIAIGGLITRAIVLNVSLLAAFGASLRAALSATVISLATIKGLIASLTFVLATLAIGEYFWNEYHEVRLFGLAFIKTWEEIGAKMAGFFASWGLWLEFAFKHPIDNIRMELSKLIVWIATAIDALNPFGDGLKNVLLDLAKFVAPKSEAFAEFNKSLDDVKANTKKTVKEIGEEMDSLANAEIQNEVAKNTKESPILNKVKAPKKPSSTDPFAIKKADLDAELQILDARFNAEEMGMRKYYAEKSRIIAAIHNNELANINAKINAEKDADKKSDLLTKRKEAETAKTTALELNRIDLSKAIADAKKESLKIGIDLDDSQLKAVGDKFDAKEKEIVDKYKKQLEDFKKSTLDGFGDTAEASLLIAEKTDLVNGLIDSEKAKNNLDRIAEEIKAFTEQQANKSKNIDILKDRGQISNSDAKSQTEAANQSTVIGLSTYQAKLQELVDKGVPDAKKSLDELTQKIAEVPVKAIQNMDVFWSNMNDGLKQTANDAAKSGLSEFFMDVASGAKSGTDAVRSFVQGFAASMAKVAADALAAWAVMKLVGFATGMAGGNPTGELNLGMAGNHHTGGIVGNTSRKVDMSMFTAAPRYHVGGIAGMQPGEVPAILQRGEEVLTQKDPRHVANGGGQGGGVRIINNIDPNLMHDYLSSSSGERVIVNLIERNSGAIKQLLG